MNDARDTRNMATERKPAHVLVLEDDDAHTELIRRGFQLASGTFRVTFAQTIRDARAVLEQDPPDLIIADWLLPDGKGIDILPRKDGHVTTPLVITTSHGNEKLAVDMLKSGAMDYVVKSEFTFKYLPRVAERVLKEWENITEQKRMQAALQETSAFLKNILDSIQDGISVLDTNCNIILVNKAMETWYAHAMPLVGKKCYEAYYGATKPCDPCPTLDTLKTGQPHRLIVPQGGAGGKIVGWQDLFVFPIFDHNTGKINGAIEYVRDITEHKRAEDALRKSEELFHGLVDTITSGVVIYEVLGEGASGTDYIIKDANRMALETESKTKDEMIGKRLADLRPAINEYGLIPVFQRVWKTGIPEYFPQKYYIDEKYANWYENRVFRLQTGEIVAVYNDVTNQKRGEEALRESEQFLENIVEQIPDMIFVKDAEDLRFVRFNKAGEDLLGYSREELMGKNDSDFFPKDQADFFIGKDRDVLRINQLTDIPEEKIQTRNKGERILHTKKIPLVDKEGQPKYLLGISEDITERKRAEEHINLANRKLALMTDVTFQDIQNKVTALRGYAEIGKERERDKEQLDILEKAVDIMESIHRLIQNTKDYQKMGMEKLQWIPLESTIRIQAGLISGGSDLSVEVSLGGLELYSDPLIERVFYNLIDNTVKHGGKCAKISFTCRENAEGLIISCEDDGVGIPHDKKARIFDRVVGGMGKFGLFFVREFLEMSGMTITETGEPGKGVRFEITVPKRMYRFNDTG